MSDCGLRRIGALTGPGRRHARADTTYSRPPVARWGERRFAEGSGGFGRDDSAAYAFHAL
eukprot:10674216-Alexandrium_andersonii.AAC.1